VVGQLYKGYHIVAFARYSDATRLWTPSVSISWLSPSGSKRFDLSDLQDHFTTAHDAEAFGIKMGIDWANRQPFIPKTNPL